MTVPQKRPPGWRKYHLDRMSPAASDAQLGTQLDRLITAVNTLEAQYAALTAKLDADVGVTDADYNSLNPTIKVPTLDDLG